MKNKTLSREEVYELVWSKPVTHIAKEFDFSESEIRKICKKYNIPLPKSGYWSKLKFNKEVVRTKLPKHEDNPQISLEKSNAPLCSADNPLSKLALRKNEIKQIKGLNLKVPDKISNPHHLITSTKNYFKQLETIRKKGGWGNELDKSKTLSLSVSDNLYPRAYRFMDSLLKLLEKRGHRIVNSEYSTQVVIKEQKYSLRLIEKNKRVKRISQYSSEYFDLIPTGNLCFKIDRTYPHKEWTDSKTKPLEERLIDILVWLEIKGEEDEQKEIANAIRQKKYEEDRIKEEALQKLKDKEFADFQGLFQSATRFQKAQYLRSYIKEFENYAKATNLLNSEKQEWIMWAKEKADWYDPFIEKEVLLLNDIDRETLAPKKKRYW